MSAKALLCSVFFLFLAFINTASAQKLMQDILYLKNGSIIRGKILEHTFEIIRIRTSDNSEWVFPADDMERIERKSVKPPLPPNSYQGFFSTSFLFGQDRWGTSIQGGAVMSHGYRFKDRYFAGLGLGIESLNEAVSSVYLDGRYNIFTGPVRPFAYTNLGWGWGLEGGGSNTKNHGGLHGEGGIGLQRTFGSSFGLVFTLGYRHQRLGYTFTDDWADSETRVTYIYDRMVFRFGFTF